jgi:nucleoside-diphosphate-sugar epimerase
VHEVRKETRKCACLSRERPERSAGGSSHTWSPPATRSRRPPTPRRRSSNWRFDRWFATTNQLRTKGTDILLAAARDAGVGRLVAQSYTGWTNPCTGGPVKTEHDGLEPHPPRMQRESLAAIRYLERVVPAAPLEGTVLRYGNFYGPGASESLVELIPKRRFPVIGDGAGVWSWTHLDDAAAATAAALERGARGVYNVTDDEPAAVSEWRRTSPRWSARNRRCASRTGLEG